MRQVYTDVKATLLKTINHQVLSKFVEDRFFLLYWALSLFSGTALFDPAEHGGPRLGMKVRQPDSFTPPSCVSTAREEAVSHGSSRLRTGPQRPESWTVT